MLPYVLGGTIPSLGQAFFETASGFTTTGATVLADIDVVPHSILLWRSMTQWVGGMGIVVLMIAIMPILGIGGMQLFSAESPGVMVDRIRPRIRETALMMWIVYISLTISAIALLWAGGISFFDAVNHAFTTLSTGGFSTHTASAAAFSPYVQYVLILFMFLAGINFALLYAGLAGRIRTFFRNEELRMYILITVCAGVFAWFFLAQGGMGLEESFRTGLFQVVSILTTTGFTTADYTTWAHPVVYILHVLTLIGGMTGSTAGGVKIMRHLVLLKDMMLEFKKQLRPDAIFPLRVNGVLIQQTILYRIIVFVVVYLLVLAVAVFLLLLFGHDMATSVGAAVATLGNIGPGFGAVGPGGYFGSFSEPMLWFLSGLMIIGRLELFTVLILFTPYFWKRY